MTVDLKAKSKYVRSSVLEMCVRTQSGHIASSLSCVEILVALYYGGVLKFDSRNPRWLGRDRFILSKGHAAPALYPILADLGYFPLVEIEKFCCPSGTLGAHPDPGVPGVEVVSGALGHGLGIGVGMALAAKMDRTSYRVIVLMGDGECYEGSVWEAAMFAGHHGLNNLTVIIDRNRMCVTEYTETGLRLEPLRDKWRAFGWSTVEVNGHDFKEIGFALDFRTIKPTAVIANTVKSKGISCMENRLGCHTTVPRGADLPQARKELA